MSVARGRCRRQKWLHHKPLSISCIASISQALTPIMSASDFSPDHRALPRMFANPKESQLAEITQLLFQSGSKAKDVMFEHTDRKKTPWHVVNADNKKQARLNCIRHLLDQIPYQEMRPVQIELPPRQPDSGYKRPKKSTQRFVPQLY